MSLVAFLRAVLDHGHVAVPAPAADEPAAEIAAAARLLAEFEAHWRFDLPGAAPTWHPEAAVLGGRLLFRAAQALLHRNIETEAIRAGLALPEPADAGTAAAHYGADLALRFLPEIARLARGLSAEDPLVDILRELGGRWPLSSVGMPGVIPTRLEPVVTHASLLQVYVDRILAVGDTPRLDDPRVAAAARRAVGGHADLLPRGFSPLSQGVAS